MCFGMVDADCATDPKFILGPITGYCFKLSNGCVSWESKKQRTTAMSMVEAECLAMTKAEK